MTRYAMAAVFVVLGAWTSGPVRAVNAQAGTCFATTASGDVQGVARGGSCAFLGIPTDCFNCGAYQYVRTDPFFFFLK